MRCRHFVKVPLVHWLSAVQGCGGVSKDGLNCWPQKPQKTNGCAERSVEVALGAPVDSANAIGRLPMKAVEEGGQSWLVGKAAPRLAESAGVQGWPALGPAWHVSEPLGPAQRGHGTKPSVGPVR